MILVDPITVGVRWFEEDDATFLDPYQWCSTGVKIDEGVIELTLCDKPFTFKIWRDIRKGLKEAGWKKIIFKRYQKGKCKTHAVYLGTQNDS